MLNTDRIEYPVENRPYKVPDRTRNLEFEGRMIGKASTQRSDGDLRWTDITIYVTEGGQYVCQKEGVSLVYHRAESTCRGGETVTNPEITEEAVPCPDCRPPSLNMLDDIRANAGPEGDPARYRREVTLSSAEVTNDPYKVATLVHYQGRLTTVATEALRRASLRDKRLGEIFGRVETIA